MATMPTRVGTAFQTTGSGSAATPNNVTTGAIAAGSWMIAVLHHNSVSITETIPAGWTVLVAGTNANAQIGTRRYTVLGKIHGQLADGTPDSTDAGKTFWPFIISANNTFRAVMYWGTGARPVSQWIVGTPRKRAGTTAEQTTAIAPSITTTTANTLVLGLHMEATSAAESDITSLSGATRWDFSAQGTGAAAGVIETVLASYIEKTTAGATGDITATYPNAQTTNAGGVQIGLPPLADVVVPGLAVKVRSASNTNVDGQMYIWNGTTGVGASAMRPVQPTSTNVTSLLATPNFVVAHRLGSKNWPEHSMHGATQSLLRGVNALEFSIGKSSDGVLFGLHDDTINRTSGTTGLPVAQQMTWADILSYPVLSSITDDPSQPNRPYLKLDDLRKAYPNAVLFLDPKYLGSAGAIAFFQNLKDTVPDATERFVFKYYFTATNLANPIGAMGFKSWGYLYEADLANANFTTYANAWTILGLDYNCSESGWADFQSRMAALNNPLTGTLGKKYTGHIAPTLAATVRPNAYGAIGNMVSGIKQVKGF